MIIERKTFEYQEKIIIEKVIFTSPYRHEAIFQNGGCFVHMKGAVSTLLSSEDNLRIANQEAVLLKCGTYFLDFLKKTKNDRVEVIAVHLYPEILKNLYLRELPALIKKRNFNGKVNHMVNEAIISRYVESLEFYFENPSLVNEDLLELKIKELILLLIQTKNVASVLELITDLYSTRNINIKNVIDLHLYSNLTIEELSRLCNLSLSSFKREFKKIYNDNPANYFINEKLKKAKELLTISDMSISEIAYEVGFNDPLYFTRLFKKKESITPSAYRTNHTH